MNKTKPISIIFFCLLAFISVSEAQPLKYKKRLNVIYPKMLEINNYLEDYSGCAEGNCKKGDGIFIAFSKSKNIEKHNSLYEKSPYTVRIFSGEFKNKGQHFSGKVFEINGKIKWIKGSNKQLSRYVPEGEIITDPKQLNANNLLFQGEMVAFTDKDKKKILWYTPSGNGEDLLAAKLNPQIKHYRLKNWNKHWLITDIKYKTGQPIKRFQGFSEHTFLTQHGTEESKINNYVYGIVKDYFFGRLTYADGSYYEGPIYQKMPHGLGKKILANGNTQEGLWYLGQLNKTLKLNMPKLKFLDSPDLEMTSYTPKLPKKINGKKILLPESSIYFYTQSNESSPNDGFYFSIRKIDFWNQNQLPRNPVQIYWGQYKNKKPAGWASTINIPAATTFSDWTSFSRPNIFQVTTNADRYQMSSYPATGVFNHAAFTGLFTTYPHLSISDYLKKESNRRYYYGAKLEGCFEIYDAANDKQFFAQLPNGWRIDEKEKLSWYDSWAFKNQSHFSKAKFTVDIDTYQYTHQLKKYLKPIIERMEKSNGICDFPVASTDKDFYLNHFYQLIKTKAQKESDTIMAQLKQRWADRDQLQKDRKEFPAFLAKCNTAKFDSSGIPKLICGKQEKPLSLYTGNNIQTGMAIYLGGHLQTMTYDLQQKLKNSSIRYYACHLDNRHSNMLTKTCPKCNGKKILTSTRENVTNYSPLIEYENGFKKTTRTTITSYQKRYEGVCNVCSGNGFIPSKWSYGN